MRIDYHYQYLNYLLHDSYGSLCKSRVARDLDCMSLGPFVPFIHDLLRQNDQINELLRFELHSDPKLEVTRSCLYHTVMLISGFS